MHIETSINHIYTKWNYTHSWHKMQLPSTWMKLEGIFNYATYPYYMHHFHTVRILKYFDLTFTLKSKNYERSPLVNTRRGCKQNQDNLSTNRTSYLNVQWHYPQHLKYRKTTALFYLYILLYYNRTWQESFLPFHHVRPTAYQAKDRDVHPLPSPEDWSMAHSKAGRSWPAELIAEVLSMVVHRHPDQMLSDQGVGQIAHSIQRTEWKGLNAHPSSRVTDMFPLKSIKCNFTFIFLCL